MELGIKGLRGVVCGGSKGLGRAAAFALAREGVNLTLFARNPEALRQTAEEIGTECRVDVDYVAGDISDPAARGMIFDACPDASILVTNPGVRQTPADFRSLDEATWHYWLNVHFLSSFELIRLYAPGMCERKFGRIVNISVSFIKFPQMSFAHTHAARVALSASISSIVRELVADNVTINTVAPGLIDTDALRTNLHGHAERANVRYEDMVADRLSGCPAKRFANASEIGDLITFLCARQMGFMTGQNIISDGGVYQGLF
jgi:3-oxoacyl-[acyl-carrier protein] reductase